MLPTRAVWARIVVAAFFCGEYSATQGAPFNLNVAPGNLTLTATLTNLQQSASTNLGTNGTVLTNLTLGNQAGFGTVVQSAGLTSADLALANGTATVDLEFLGSLAVSTIGVSGTLDGPTNSSTPPPLGAGQTKFSLAGSALRLNEGIIRYAGQGVIGPAVGTVDFDLSVTPLVFNFPASFWQTTVSGSSGNESIAASIPISLSQTLQFEPFRLDLMLSGVLALTGGANCVVSPLVGDANNDGSVGAADYAIWAAQFGQTGDCLPADFDRNGSVGAGDYTLWAANFGNTLAGAGAASSVPEPGSLLLGLSGIALLAFPFARRRRARGIHMLPNI